MVICRCVPNCVIKAKSVRNRVFIGDQIDDCKDLSGLYYLLPFQKVILYIMYSILCGVVSFLYYILYCDIIILYIIYICEYIILYYIILYYIILVAYQHRCLDNYFAPTVAACRLHQ